MSLESRLSFIDESSRRLVGSYKAAYDDSVFLQSPFVLVQSLRRPVRTVDLDSHCVDAHKLIRPLAETLRVRLRGSYKSPLFKDLCRTRSLRKVNVNDLQC